jgi:uncharacterized protein YjbI with pentapeptide repeats
VEPTSGTPRTDIQAVLDVLKRREEEHVPEKHRVRLDLRGTDLRGANLRGAYLRGAYLREAFLIAADLRRAFLREADLRKANLRKADLREAYLLGANELTQEQIEWTIGSNETALPEGLDRPQSWSKSTEEQTKIVQERLERGL